MNDNYNNLTLFVYDLRHIWQTQANDMNKHKLTEPQELESSLVCFCPFNFNNSIHESFTGTCSRPLSLIPLIFLLPVTIFKWVIHNLVEIRVPKKFSVCISIPISSQALSKVFWKLKIWRPMHILSWMDCQIKCR